MPTKQGKTDAIACANSLSYIALLTRLHSKNANKKGHCLAIVQQKLDVQEEANKTM
jgi:hypothetical protein